IYLSFQVPWFEPVQFIHEATNFSNFFYWFLFLGVISGFLLNFSNVVLERIEDFCIKLFIIFFSFLLVLPMVYYMTVDSIHLMNLEYIGSFEIIEGYRISFFGNMILIFNLLIKIGILIYQYGIRRQIISSIKNSEYMEKIINSITIERISVNPKVSYACVNAADSQQDSRDYNDSCHSMTLELPQKQPS
ncbi:MAG: hypothetical protein ACFFE5_08495, partial [Candidatus Thorarchaeota archaeon]